MKCHNCERIINPADLAAWQLDQGLKFCDYCLDEFESEEICGKIKNEPIQKI